jgi:hypothetical protein
MSLLGRLRCMCARHIKAEGDEKREARPNKTP